MSLVVCAEFVLPPTSFKCKAIMLFKCKAINVCLIVRAECAKGVEQENQMDSLFCLEVSVGEVVRVAMLC